MAKRRELARLQRENGSLKKELEELKDQLIWKDKVLRDYDEKLAASKRETEAAHWKRDKEHETKLAAAYATIRELQAELHSQQLLLLANEAAVTKYETPKKESSITVLKRLMFTATGKVFGDVDYIRAAMMLSEYYVRLTASENDSFDVKMKSDLSHIYGEIRDVAGLLAAMKNRPVKSFLDLGAGFGKVGLQVLFEEEKCNVTMCEADKFRYKAAYIMFQLLFAPCKYFDIRSIREDDSAFQLKTPWGTSLTFYHGEALDLAKSLNMPEHDLVLADIVIPRVSTAKFVQLFNEMKAEAGLVTYTPPICIREGREYVNYASDMPTAASRQDLLKLGDTFETGTELPLKTSWSIGSNRTPFYFLKRKPAYSFNPLLRDDLLRNEYIKQNARMMSEFLTYMLRTVTKNDDEDDID